MTTKVRLDRARGVVDGYAREAVEAWQAAAEHLAAALRSVEAGKTAARRAYAARKTWAERARADGMPVDQLAAELKTMPVPTLPIRLRSLVGQARSLKTLRTELHQFAQDRTA